MLVGGGEGEKGFSHCVNLLTLRAILGGFGFTAHRTAHVIGSSRDSAAGNIARQQGLLPKEPSLLFIDEPHRLNQKRWTLPRPCVWGFGF